MKENECLDKKLDTYNIQFGDKSFKYYLCYSGLENCIDQLYNLDGIQDFIVISDDKVGNLYGQDVVDLIKKKYKCELLIFKCSENDKNLETLSKLIEDVLALNATRRTCIIGLGGGICGNISGMVAALLYRGLKFVHIPTSLMAILDSVLSLKQAINSHLGKNLIGTYYVPQMVIANMPYIKTLPNREIIAGLCEVVKNALTIVPDSIDKMLELSSPQCNYSCEDFSYFIDMSIKAKLKVMENDPFEKGTALILEYGHTIGHAIELASCGKMSHGEAVGLGMICAAQVSHSLGFLSEEDIQLHKRLLTKIGAATKIDKNIELDKILSIMRFDNKRGYIDIENNDFYMVLLESIGKPLINNGKLITAVPEAVVKQAIMKTYE